MLNCIMRGKLEAALRGIGADAVADSSRRHIERAAARCVRGMVWCGGVDVMAAAQLQQGQEHGRYGVACVLCDHESA